MVDLLVGYIPCDYFPDRSISQPATTKPSRTRKASHVAREIVTPTWEIVTSVSPVNTPLAMPACHMKPADKKAFISAVGKELVRSNGKKKYYKTTEVRRAANSCGYAPDIHCWAYCFYSSASDFTALHEAAGEKCDYVAMKTELLSDMASGGGFSLLDVDLSWLEWPDINLSSIFDWFDFS